MKMKSAQNDMTVGNPMKIILSFTFPIFLGNVFQQFYNMADAVIVGKFVGNKALAAVGSTGTIMFLIYGFVVGMTAGFTVLTAQKFGAGDMEGMRKTVVGAGVLSFVIGTILTILFMVFMKPLLILMNTPSDIFADSYTYIMIVSGGILAQMLYNLLSSILRALGNSKLPLYFLIISAILNIFGDLFFVIVLEAGSNGCAISTVLSEALCCLFCIIYIQKKVPILRLGKKWLVFDAGLLKKTIAYGWASAMQQATVQMGKIAIQALVNTMGVSVAAAFAVVNRIDDFAITPEQNIAHAMTALMAQNKGAGKNDRMREGFRCGMILELVYGAAVMLICLGFARPLMSLFVKDEEVIGHGVVYLHLIAVMYILPAVTNALQGFFRGIGDLKVTLMSSFTNMTVRVIAAAPMVLLWNFGIEALPYSYLAGWIAMLLVETPLMLRIYRKK